MPGILTSPLEDDRVESALRSRRFSIAEVTAFQSLQEPYRACKSLPKRSEEGHGRPVSLFQNSRAFSIEFRDPLLRHADNVDQGLGFRDWD